MFFKMVEPTESRKPFASLPYIKGVTEPLTHVLKKHCYCHRTVFFCIFLELLITRGPTTTPLILKTHHLLTKALLEPEKH